MGKLANIPKYVAYRSRPWYQYIVINYEKHIRDLTARNQRDPPVYKRASQRLATSACFIQE